jgi:hypothetical protein
MTYLCDRFCQKVCHDPAFISPWYEPDPKIEPMDPVLNRHGCTRLHQPRRSLDFDYSCATVTITEASPHHVLLVLAAPRPRTTLGKTLESLRAAGSDSWPGPKILLSDCPVDHFPGIIDHRQWHVFGTPAPLGSARAYARAFRVALAVDPDLNHLTILEDDVELCSNALTYMSRVEVPDDVAFVTWFTYDYDWRPGPHAPVKPSPAERARDENRGILAARPSRFFILTQAVTFPRRTADNLLECPMFGAEWTEKDGHDLMIGHALGDAKYAAHFPVLVQHTGGLSSAVKLARKEPPKHDAQEGARTSPHYVGPDFDAITLLRDLP